MFFSHINIFQQGFFRRSLRRKTEYKCVKSDKNCTIAPGKRNGCPLCRYNKCLAVGMSKEGKHIFLINLWMQFKKKKRYIK